MAPQVSMHELHAEGRHSGQSRFRVTHVRTPVLRYGDALGRHGLGDPEIHGQAWKIMARKIMARHSTENHGLEKYWPVMAWKLIAIINCEKYFEEFDGENIFLGI